MVMKIWISKNFEKKVQSFDLSSALDIHVERVDSLKQGSSIILAHVPQKFVDEVQSATKCHKSKIFLL